MRDAVSVLSNCARSFSTSGQHFAWNLAILLAPGPTPMASGGILDKVKTYIVLALVNEDTKFGKNGSIVAGWSRLTANSSLW
jgi:hypothetical protein